MGRGYREGEGEGGRSGGERGMGREAVLGVLGGRGGGEGEEEEEEGGGSEVVAASGS